MAIITEEEDETKTPIPPKNKESSKPQSQNTFPVWFYFTLILSFATILFTSLSTFSSHNDPRSWFLSLPQDLRKHYSDGRTIKVQLSPNESPIEVFVTESGPPIHQESVMILHGLGLSSYAFKELIKSLGSKGIHGVAIDLPGNGFSDKTKVVIGGDSEELSFVSRVKEVYSLIKDKGLFWAFDHMVETGDLPYEEIIKIQNSKRRRFEAIELGSEVTSKVLGQVIDTLSLAPVHLVLHDSALVLASNWISENTPSVASITLIDSSVSPALPLWVLNIPLIREVVLTFSFGFEKFVSFRCAKEMTLSEIEGHRILLKGGNGRVSVVASLKRLNHSFDIGQWGSSGAINGIPMQLIWSKEWSEEGHRVATSLPKAKFVTHSGSRWPQESNSGELAEYIVDFVSLLPKSVRRVAEKPLPEKVQEMLDEAKAGGENGDYNGHGHAHAGYSDAYGLGEEWTT